MSDKYTVLAEWEASQGHRADRWQLISKADLLRCGPYDASSPQEAYKALADLVIAIERDEVVVLQRDEREALVRERDKLRAEVERLREINRTQAELTTRARGSYTEE